MGEACTLYIGIFHMIIFITWSDTHLHEVGAPIIHIDTPDLVTTENSTVELTCTGAYTLEWLYPSSLQTDKITSTSTACPTCPPALRHQSILRIEKMMSMDTNAYQCVYSRFLDNIGNGTSAEVYIFVRSNGEFVHILQCMISFLLTRSVVLVSPNKDDWW